MSGVKAVKKKPPKGLKRPPPSIKEEESEDDFFASLGVKPEEKEESDIGSEKINYDESDVTLININKSDSDKSQLSAIDNKQKEKIKKKVKKISKGSLFTDGVGMKMAENKTPSQNKIDIKNSESSLTSVETKKANVKPSKSSVKSADTNKTSGNPSKITVNSVGTNKTNAKSSKGTVSSTTINKTNAKPSKNTVNTTASSKTNAKSSKNSVNSSVNSKSNVNKKAVKSPVKQAVPLIKEKAITNKNSRSLNSEKKSDTVVKKKPASSKTNTETKSQSNISSLDKADLSQSDKSKASKVTKSGTTLSSNSTLTAAEKEVYKINDTNVPLDKQPLKGNSEVQEMIDYLNNRRINLNTAMENYDECKTSAAASNITNESSVLEKKESFLSSVISYFMPSQKYDSKIRVTEGTAVDKLSFNDLWTMTNRNSVEKRQQNQDYELVQAIYCFIKGNGDIKTLEELLKQHKDFSNAHSSSLIQYNNNIFVQANNLVHCLRNTLQYPFDKNLENKTDHNLDQNTSVVDQHCTLANLKSKSSACLHANNPEISTSKVSYSSLKSSQSMETKEGTFVKLKKSISALFGRLFSQNNKEVQTSDQTLKRDHHDTKEPIGKKDGTLTTLKKSASNLFNLLNPNYRGNTSTKVEIKNDEILEENRNDDQIRKFIQKNVFPEQINKGKEYTLSDCKSNKKKYRIEDIRDMRKKEHKQDEVLISQLMKRMSQLSVKLCDSAHNPYYSLSLNYFDYASGYESPTSSSTEVNELI